MPRRCMRKLGLTTREAMMRDGYGRKIPTAETPNTLSPGHGEQGKGQGTRGEQRRDRTPAGQSPDKAAELPPPGICET